MKMLFRIVSILLVMAMLPAVAFAQTQEEWNITQEKNSLNNAQASSLDNHVTDMPSYSGYDVNLLVDGGYLYLFVTDGYKLQAYELYAGEEYPFSYTFINEDACAKFVVYSNIAKEKDQDHWLRKLYDVSNKFIIFEDVMIGGYAYIVYTKEQATYDYEFLIREGKGYSYQFQYVLPYDTIQNEIPAEAISILSTLSIQESFENTD